MGVIGMMWDLWETAWYEQGWDSTCQVQDSDGTTSPLLVMELGMVVSGV